MKLVYSGPLAECGFRGPVTRKQYLARQDEPFTVDKADGEALLRRYPDHLGEVKSSSRRKSKSAAKSQTDVKPDEDNGTLPDNNTPST